MTGNAQVEDIVNGTLERLYTGSIWAEGPVWIPWSRTVRWSDIPNSRILEFEAATGQGRDYATGVEFTNGRTLDHDGSVIQCSHGRRRVERDRDGTVTPVVESFEGRRLNSPNDVVVARDGAIWFTDPPYGILPGTPEGHEGEQEYGGCYVFRYQPATGILTPAITDLVHPNGLAFSPDESTLYVSDTAGPDRGVPLRIAAYDLEDGTGVRARTFVEFEEGYPADGFRVDREGRLWTSAGPSVRVYSPEAQLLAAIEVPEKVANVCFGGPDGQDLYVAASTSLYRIRTRTTDAVMAAPGVSESPSPYRPLVRQVVLDVKLPRTTSTDRIQVRRIKMLPGYPAGLHVHNGPVVGSVVEGSVVYQIEGAPESTLGPGDLFYEPEGARIARFDAGADGAVFLAYFLLRPNQEAAIEYPR